MISLSSDLAGKCRIDFDRDDNHEDRCVKVLYFQLMVDLIEKLGWHEHTSDWDPSIAIEFEDGDVIVETNTEPGYTEFIWLDKDEKEVHIDELDEKPGETICCDSGRIKYIQLLLDYDDKKEEWIKSGMISIDSLTKMEFWEN